MQQAWLKIRERQTKPAGSTSDSIYKLALPHTASGSSSENEWLVNQTKLVESFFSDLNKETRDELDSEGLLVTAGQACHIPDKEIRLDSSN